MEMKMKKYLISVILITTFLTGCQSTAGRHFDTTKAGQIIEGVSTKMDVLRLLGDPYRTDMVGRSKEKLMYFYAKSNISLFAIYGGSSDSDREILNITIQDGVVAECTLSRSFSQGSGFGGMTSSVSQMGAGGSSTLKCSDLR
jgi:outer membrane protein assembly factor BamE (lipoprotein component of BamABCDE complex)